MDEKMIGAKLAELEQDAEFASKLESAGTLEEVAALFGSEGIEVSADDLRKAAEMDAANGGELGETDLEDVSGGSWRTSWVEFLRRLEEMIRRGGRPKGPYAR